MTCGPQPQLERADIQGNILEGYRLPLAQYRFFRIADPAGGRRFVSAVTTRVTTADYSPGDAKPDPAVNIGFTHRGLTALQLPSEALDGFPLDFRQGMLARVDLLADRGESAPDRWEPMWRTGDVHIWISINAQTPNALEACASWLERCTSAPGGVTEILPRQDAAMFLVDGKRKSSEHFGYTDGFGNPFVAGADLPRKAGKMPRGLGRPLPNGEWAPIAAGEFLLGHLNEQGEVAPTPHPAGLFRNGTFMVYRKLHQKVATFRRFLEEEGRKYPGGPKLLAAKLVGRWPDGTPLALSPEEPYSPPVNDDDRLKKSYTDFRYSADPDGLCCPLSAHIRRANPRDALQFASGQALDPALAAQLTARRRIIRRGLPYGAWIPEDQPADDDGEHGVIFMALNASLEHQFEFVQQRWMNYGSDFRQGNDPDPLAGNRRPEDKLLIPGGADAPGGHPPHICFGLPLFVVTRGGDYFFLPSLSALHWLAEGSAP
jgi:Dyp-type peroxidase family